MYSKIDFNTSNERYESKSKKKYELSLKRSKFAVVRNDGGTIENDKRNNESFDVDDTTNDVSSSQDFKLRVSDSFFVEDTQAASDGKDVRWKNSDDDEVILISDSDEEATPRMDRWTRLKQSELTRDERKKSLTPPSAIYTIGSSDSDDNATEKRENRSPEIASDFVTMRKCSVTYTSDETFGDIDSTSLNNKENSSEARARLSSKNNAVTESDEATYNFEKMRGVLTENRRNIDNRESPKERHARTEIPRKIPTSDKTRRARDESEKIPTEMSLRIDEWRRNIESSKISKNKTASLKNLADIDEENRRNAKLTNSERKKTGSLRDIDDEIDDDRSIIESSRKKTSSLNNLRETNERTPEVTRKIAKERTGGTSEAKNSRGISSRTTVLSRKDVKNIMKIVESKRAIYQSPMEHKKSSKEKEKIILSSESEDDERREKNIVKPVVIDETDSDSDEEIIRGSKIDLAKPYKTHITRFLDPTTNHDNTPDLMSERKKLEIAHWLMNNEGHSRSESSLSVVTPSNRNSLSSGNSSLERLEMNYETPNNRAKISKKKIIDHRGKSGDKDSAKSTKLRQTTIDNYLEKSHDGNCLVLTPVPVSTRKKNQSPESGRNIDIMDCADILDNLYGNSWRSRANDLLPSTEPRKKNVVLRDKGVQTERKFYPTSRKMTKSSDSDSQDDGFHAFVQNIKPNFNSTKKSTKKPVYDRCSFINDSPLSPESSGETTFLTALTNPRISDDHKINNLPTPASLHVRRAIAICDSDTDDNNEETPKKAIDNKKILSYTDDESDSVTSEYDPDDVLPEKKSTKSRGGFAKSKNIDKNTTAAILRGNGKKSRCTFLESLSAAVPINEAHPDVKKYRQDYKNTKEELCKLLYRLYNEKIFDKQLPADLTIEWNVRMRGTAGFCYNKRSLKALGGVARSSRIVLATKILDTPDRLRDTLVHEMCHAAAWLINDVSDGHGPFWKAWAAKAMKTFPELPPIKRCHDYKITTKFTYRCTGCGYSVGRHSKSLNIETKRCGHCYGKFELLINKMTKSGKIETKTPAAKKPTGFALFVKDNYSSVKKERKGVSHKELMQILGAGFKNGILAGKKWPYCIYNS